MDSPSARQDASQTARPRALLLDMDGTITAPMLDFPRIKSEMGIGEQAILEALAEMAPEARTAAEAVLLKHEQAAARASTLNPGCRELLDWAAAHHVSTALITRNSRASARVVMERHGLNFDVMITRDDGRFKPHPEPLLRACRRLGVATEQVWMIGDGSHDVSSGLAAGIRTVWISHGRERPFDSEPWRIVQSLRELLEMLAGCAATPDRSEGKCV